uniref:Sulfotransferase domain-containing protein n=1 Tax=Heterosigma akashiwo TaxID=2829 RepID=A0A7S3URN0_HETAK
MGRSDQHKYYFIKPHPVLSWEVETVTRAFPTTPWVYLFRNPVEVLMSQLVKYQPPGASVYGGFCLSRVRIGQDWRPEEKVHHILGSYAMKASREEYCAAFLHSLDQYMIDSIVDSSPGIPVEYPNLVNKFLDIYLPKHFLVKQTERQKYAMKEVTLVYSKQRAPNKAKFAPGSSYKDDTKKKEHDAWPELVNGANRILDKSFKILKDMETKALARLNSSENAY